MAALRRIRARYRGRCRTCKGAIIPDQVIYYDGFSRLVYCEPCGSKLSKTQNQTAGHETKSGQQSTRTEIHVGYLIAGLVVAVCALFGIGLSSDRIWPAMLIGTIVCTAVAYLSGSRVGRTWLLVTSIGLLVLTAGSVTRDFVDGGLFDHPPTALCSDGSYSYSQHRGGTCSWHRGVAVWNPQVPWWRRI